MSIKVTYLLERRDTPNFHGWVIFACSDGLEEEYYANESWAKVRAVLRDLGILN